MGVVAAGLLFGALNAGGTPMQSATGMPDRHRAVMQSLIVLFIAAPPLVRVDVPAQGAVQRVGGQLAKGWNG